MDGGDHQLRSEGASGLCGYGRDGFVFDNDVLHRVAGYYLSAPVGDASGQRVGQLLAASHEAGRAGNEQYVDQGVDVCRRMAGTAAVYRVKVCQQFAQHLVTHMFCNQPVGRHAEPSVFPGHVGNAGAEIEQRYAFRNVEQFVDVCLDSFGLFGKLSGKNLDEILPARANDVRLAVLTVTDAVGAVGVEVFYLQPGEDAEIIAYPGQVASGLESAHDVHTGLKQFVAASEALQPASDGGVFLYHCHLVSVARQ